MILNKQNGEGFGRVIKAARCSISGYRYAWLYESAFRQEVVLAALLFPLSLYVADSLTHWVLLVASVALVLICELLNSALETLCDRLTLERDEAIKRVKDIASAAVMTSLVLTCIVWGAVFLSRFY